MGLYRIILVRIGRVLIPIADPKMKVLALICTDEKL
jgi:hypothetical protein